MSDYMSQPHEQAKQPDALATCQMIAKAAGPLQEAAVFNALWSFWNFSHVFDDLMDGSQWADEKKALATMDPISEMAQVDGAALDLLLRDVQTGSEALQTMLAELAADAGIIPPDFQPVGADEQGRLDEKSKTKCPECGHEF